MAPVSAPEASVGQTISCPACGRRLFIACAEVLAEGAAMGDFDAHLTVTSGPSRNGEQILLGGVPEITIGKLPDRTIVLPGNMVSRGHCKLMRLDFGPSRWEIQDNNSTNGLFVNGERVQTRELRDEDVVTVGDYDLKFTSTFERDTAAAKTAADKAAIAAGASVCPSCRQVLGQGAKICTSCGVDVKSGRSLVMSKGLDEESLAVNADNWIRVLSWIIPFGVVPVASEAFGTRKPIATWVIAAITTVVSIGYFIAWHSTGADEEPGPAVQNMMQWSGHPPTVAEVEKMLREARDEARQSRYRGDRELAEATDEELREAATEHVKSLEGVGFHWYQLITAALIHNTDNIVEFVFHLGGNMLFFFVFGMRVNELIGNAKFGIVYPLLAIGSGLVSQIMHMGGTLQAGLGASGAIMGLAGMYFVLFPIQRVHMVAWIRMGILTGWRCFYKLFRMHGFWLLVLWVGYHDLLPMIFNFQDNVGHWAHVGGFVVGAGLCLGLLLSRQTSAHGNDILSVALGRRAWALVGKPGGARA
jgi:membrane associated rhomboid family serine protease/pSer/pThr/pTyr-binding forkhead associated (FHA) protein